MLSSEQAGPDSIHASAPITLEGKAKIQDAVEVFGEAQGWPRQIRNEFNLILEELLQNIISYSQASCAEMMELGVIDRGSLAEVSITDPGIEFNPLTLAEPDLTLPIEERAIGGLGVLMVKRLVDSIEWKREAGRNHLRFLKSTVLPKLN